MQGIELKYLKPSLQQVHLSICPLHTIIFNATNQLLSKVRGKKCLFIPFNILNLRW